MKCARCGREMDKAAAFVGGHPIGPTCWRKMGDKPSKVKLPKVYRVVQNLLDHDQKDLFDDANEDHAGNPAQQADPRDS